MYEGMWTTEEGAIQHDVVGVSRESDFDKGDSKGDIVSVGEIEK